MEHIIFRLYIKWTNYERTIKEIINYSSHVYPLEPINRPEPLTRLQNCDFGQQFFSKLSIIVHYHKSNIKSLQCLIWLSIHPLLCLPISLNLNLSQQQALCLYLSLPLTLCASISLCLRLSLPHLSLVSDSWTRFFTWYLWTPMTWLEAAQWIIQCTALRLWKFRAHYNYY